MLNNYINIYVELDFVETLLILGSKKVPISDIKIKKNLHIWGKREKRKQQTSTFMQDVPQCDPLPWDGDVFHFSFGLQQSNTPQVILLYAQRWVTCENGEEQTWSPKWSKGPKSTLRDWQVFWHWMTPVNHLGDFGLPSLSQISYSSKSSFSNTKNLNSEFREFSVTRNRFIKPCSAAPCTCCIVTASCKVLYCSNLLHNLPVYSLRRGRVLNTQSSSQSLNTEA